MSGALFAGGWVDQVLAYVSPRLIGGAGSQGPLAGPDPDNMAEALELDDVVTERIGGDLRIRGFVRKASS